MTKTSKVNKVNRHQKNGSDIAEAERKGGLDANIRNESHNALEELVKTLPALRAIAFNGGTAARIGRKRLRSLTDRLVLIDLPSSSPGEYAGIRHETASMEDSG